MSNTPKKNSTSLIRLDASPYQSKSFFERERAMAQELGLSYHGLNLKNKEQTELEKFIKDECTKEESFILISNTHTPTKLIPCEILDRTLLLMHPNSGHDNFSLDWVEKQGFPIVLGNSIRHKPVTEYILGLLFHHFAFHPRQRKWSAERIWERALISKKNILIIGFGHIGKTLSEVLTPIAKKVMLFDPFEHLGETPLKKLLPHSDIILVAASLNPSSRELLGEKEFLTLPHDFLLINGARGELIDQTALVKILKERPKSFAYLDVFESEPFNEDEFEGLDNIHTTSHIAGVSQHLNEDILSFELQTLKDFFSSDLEEFTHKYDKQLLHKRKETSFLK